MAYVQVRNTVFRLSLRGRVVRTMLPSPTKAHAPATSATGRCAGVLLAIAVASHDAPVCRTRLLDPIDVHRCRRAPGAHLPKKRSGCCQAAAKLVEICVGLGASIGLRPEGRRSCTSIARPADRRGPTAARRPARGAPTHIRWNNRPAMTAHALIDAQSTPTRYIDPGTDCRTRWSSPSFRCPRRVARSRAVLLPRRRPGRHRGRARGLQLHRPHSAPGK
jgi:hypothetical protein